MRQITGAAGLGYVVGVGIENMAVLEAPTFDSPVADIRSAYGDQALLAVTSFAGAAALAFYCVFAAGLFSLLRAAGRRDDVWPLVGLAAGIAGPAVAALGIAADAVLVAHQGTGLSGSVTRALFDLHLFVPMIAGPFVALFLIGMGVGGLRSNALPPWLARLSFVAAVPLALAPLAAFTGHHGLQVGVTVAFGVQTLWIFLASIWVALAPDESLVSLIGRAAFLVLSLAAGLVGIALLAAPSATGAFFSWELEPAPLAAFAGGVYVGSAVVYAVALAGPWERTGGLVWGAVVLSVSVLTATLVHLEAFDFGRLQTWAWLVLFAAFSLITIGILALGGRRDEAGTRLAPGARAALGAIAVLLGALGVTLWVDPGAIAETIPFTLPPLGGRFAGSWIALLAVLAGWAAADGRAEEARLPALALIALPAGALVAALRTLSDFEPASAATYMTALALLLACGVAVLRSTTQQPRTVSRPRRETNVMRNTPVRRS